MRSQFTLIVDGPDLQDDANLAALYAAGCDDATAGRVGTVQYLDFDREAESFPAAVEEAVDAVEGAVPGAQVVHLEPDDLVTMAEIAQRVGRTRESIRLYITGARGPGGFPAPETHLRSRHRMWRWSAVAPWLAENLGAAVVVDDPGVTQWVSAFNAGTAFRRYVAFLDLVERDNIERFLARRADRVVSAQRSSVTRAS